MTLQRCLMFALVLSLTGCTEESPASSSAATVARPADQAKPAVADSGRCPLQGAELDKLTPYRWKVAQYRADHGFMPAVGVRVDSCELIGSDDNGRMQSGLMVTIASEAHAAAFAKHWHAVCADSLMPEARGTVRPVPGVPGGQQCVTANGSSSYYWIESPGRTIQLEPETEDPSWQKVLPRLMAAVAQ